MSNVISSRLIVLGSGPAGYTAAIYAARAGLSPIVIQGIQPGGQLTTTTDVENYPGFRDVIQGPWLMEEMQAQAEHVGTKMVWDHIAEVDFSRRPFILKGQPKSVPPVLEPEKNPDSEAPERHGALGAEFWTVTVMEDVEILNAPSRARAVIV